MGGRGGAGLSITSAQAQKMKNLKNLVTESGYTGLNFSKDENGAIAFSYTREKLYAREHGGKMISPDKADTIRRTEQLSGTIAKDGLIRRNKTQKTEIVIKYGREKRK